MGVNISPIKKGHLVEVQGVGVEGLQEPKVILDCGNSGTTMRLMLGLLVGKKDHHFVIT